MILASIGAYVENLRDNRRLVTSSSLVKENNIREIRSRLKKLAKIDVELEAKKRQGLNEEFPGDFI